MQKSPAFHRFNCDRFCPLPVHGETRTRQAAIVTLTNQQPQEQLMPTQQLKSQLEDLQRILAETDQPLSSQERASLQELADRIEARLLAREAENRTDPEDAGLVDSVNLSIEHFYARHPTVAGTLQRVVQALSDMGI
jgi:hypothetical protein